MMEIWGFLRLTSSYRVVVEEFMERRVVALAKGGGFQEVLVALDASADAEYPVVESAGGILGCGGGHCDRWGHVTEVVPVLQGHPCWWAPSAEPSWSPSSRATSTPRHPRGRR